MSGNTFEITILGSGSAIPTTERNPTSQIVNISGRYFLADCGEGTQIQIRRHKIGFGRIKHIFISHLHGDHYYGLIGLISTFNLLGLKNNIHIYAPSQLKDIIQPQINFIKGEMQFDIIWHPLDFKKPRTIFADRRVEVISFPLKHSISCCGFLFKEIQKEANIRKECIEKYKIPIADIKQIKQGADYLTAEGVLIPNAELTIPPLPAKSYAFCSDTAWYPDIVKTIKNTTLLYHESTFTEDLNDWAKNTYHSTALDAAKIAQLAGAGKLILGHFSARYKDTGPFVKEASEIFRNTEAAVDGQTYQV
ncbi:MAG: ribonuclease Z [Prolixibacteraceae bacterium]|nr:ribonuclease Z [Prolixibacteraceae bacterium]